MFVDRKQKFLTNSALAVMTGLSLWGAKEILPSASKISADNGRRSIESRINADAFLDLQTRIDSETQTVSYRPSGSVSTEGSTCEGSVLFYFKDSNNRGYPGDDFRVDLDPVDPEFPALSAMSADGFARVVEVRSNITYTLNIDENPDGRFSSSIPYDGQELSFGLNNCNPNPSQGGPYQEMPVIYPFGDFYATTPEPTATDTPTPTVTPTPTPELATLTPTVTDTPTLVPTATAVVPTETPTPEEMCEAELLVQAFSESISGQDATGVFSGERVVAERLDTGDLQHKMFGEHDRAEFVWQLHPDQSLDVRVDFELSDQYKPIEPVLVENLECDDPQEVAVSVEKKHFTVFLPMILDQR